jgi:hypothetical protein
VFGLSISEGAIANILARAEAPLTRAADAIAATVRSSTVIASDETSARVIGQTWWQWVLTSSTAVYHRRRRTQADPTMPRWPLMKTRLPSSVILGVSVLLARASGTGRDARNRADGLRSRPSRSIGST